MISPKPEIQLDLSGAGAGALKASGYLAALDETATHFREMDIRHPLGTYNLSVNRVGDKVATCANNLEMLWRTESSIINAIPGNIHRSVIDYLELSSYAAAEHVDDINIIASSFFSNNKERDNSPIYKTLQKEMKPLRDRVASITNIIKHQQGRIRLYSLEINHNDYPMLLHGFFVEGFKNGSVCPSHILHGNGEEIISVTAYLWSIVVFVMRTSDVLCDFIDKMKAYNATPLQIMGSPRLTDAVLALLRLPNYSLDDMHPFLKTRLVLNNLDMDGNIMSDFYGSFYRPWIIDSKTFSGGSELRFEGDGASKTFKMILPKKFSLHYWD